MTTGDAGEPLVGQGVTPGIVRIGDTVHRPVRPFTSTIDAFLTHLHAHGFTDAPRPLGRDEHGREVLTYVEGEVPREPLPDYATTDEVLAALARLLRRQHDAAQGWVVPGDAVWGAIPGDRTGTVPLFDAPELVAHQDYCPGNVVFRDGLPAGLIDFDLARPTTRLADLANALYWWALLVDPVDRPPALVDADVPRRVALFADAYGMSAEQRRALVPVAQGTVRNMHVIARAAARVDPVFRRFWDEGVGERMPRAVAWLDREADRIRSALGA